MTRFRETCLLSCRDPLILDAQDFISPAHDQQTNLRLTWTRRSAGDCIPLTKFSPGSPSQDALLWAYDAESPQQMQFSGVRVPGRACWTIQVDFPVQVYPNPALAAWDGVLFAYVLDDRGGVWVFRLTDFQSGLQQSMNAVDIAANAINLGEKIGGMKQIVFWGACGGCVCMGGTQGGAVAIRIKDMHLPNVDRALATVDLWEGYVQRAITTAFRGCLYGPGLISATTVPCEICEGGEALALLFEDGSIRAHDVWKSSLLATATLEVPEHSSPISIVHCAQSSLCRVESPTCLAVQFAGLNSCIKNVECWTKGRRLQLTANTMVKRDFRENFCLMSAVHWEGKLWLGLIGSTCESEVVQIPGVQCVNWAEDHPHIQRVRSEKQLIRQARLWKTNLDIALHGTCVEDAFPQYFLGKILEIGPFSSPALQDVLRDVLVDFTDVDWQTRNSSRMTELIQAAAFSIQNKCPHFSLVTCFWTVTQMYYAKWMRRHLPVKLVLSPDQSSLFLVRSGGILSIVRKMLPVDQTMENARSKKINWLSCPVDPVLFLLHSALRLRSICGDIFLDSCTLAILRGCDPCKDVVPAAVTSIISPVEGEDQGGFDRERWHSLRTNLLYEINTVLMRIAPQNFPEAVDSIRKLCSTMKDESEMDEDGPSTPVMQGLISFSSDFLKQNSFCRQQLLSGVAIVLGLLMQTRKEVALHINYRTRAFIQLVKSWVKSATLHSLCGAALSIAGQFRSHPDNPDLDVLCKTSSIAQDACGLASVGHSLAAYFVHKPNTLTQSHSTLSAVANKAGVCLDCFTCGNQEDEEGFVFEVYEFAVKSFLAGSWQPVHVLSSAQNTFREDIRLHFIVALSMAASLASINNKQEKDLAEEDVFGQIVQTLEALRKAPSKLSSKFNALVSVLYVSYTCDKPLTGDAAGTVTYLETMVFVLDSIKAHTAAALVAQEAIAIIQDFTDKPGYKHLLSHLWEQVFHHGCASGNYSLALTALSESPRGSRKSASFNMKVMVASMCKRGCVDELLSFPFGSKSMSVVESLKSLAAMAPVNAMPQPYEILHLWHKQAGDYQSSAESLVGFARRIEESALDSPGSLQAIHGLLVRAALALGICGEFDAWVEDPRKRSLGQLPPTTGLDELRREHAKLEGLIKLEQCTGKETWDSIPPCSRVAKELLNHGMYDYVLKNIRYMFKPCDQVTELKTAFSHIALEWLKTGNEDGGIPRLHKPPPLESLLQWLNEYDSSDIGFCLRFTVLEKILQDKSNPQIPWPLLEMCREDRKRKNGEMLPTSTLVALLHRYERSDMAVDVLIDQTRAAYHQLDMNQDLKLPEQHVPVHLIELIRNDLKAAGDAVKLQELEYSLQSFLKLHTHVWGCSQRTMRRSTNVFFD